MKIRISQFAIYCTISVALLMLTFRVDLYLKNFTFGAVRTLGSYFVLAFLLTAMATYLAPWIVSHLLPNVETGGWTDVIMTALIAFGLFCAMSLSFGPLGADFPGTRTRGIFFAEWKFVNFVFYDALPLSLIAAALRRLERRSAQAVSAG
jgi:hypothetical protein